MKVNFGRIIILPEKEWVLNILKDLLQCKICMNILNDPYDCLCCNQTFCKNCITNYINTNKKCPYSQFFGGKDNKIEDTRNQLNKLKPTCSNIVKLINSLKFSCMYESKGCYSELNIEDLSEHEKVCKFKNDKNSTFNSMNNIDSFNGKKEKYKFQDSCLSFRKVDICPFDNSNLSSSMINLNNNDNSSFQNSIVSKIDSLYELVTKLMNNNNNGKKESEMKKPIQLYNTTTEFTRNSKLAKKIKVKGKEKTQPNLNNNNNNFESTPKFNKTVSKEFPDDISELFLSSQSPKRNKNKNIKKIENKINKIASKISNIEHLLQASNSMKTQNYFVQTNQSQRNDDYLSSVLSTKSSQFDSNLYSSLNGFKMGNGYSVMVNPITSYNIRKKFSQQVYKNNVQFNNIKHKQLLSENVNGNSFQIKKPASLIQSPKTKDKINIVEQKDQKEQKSIENILDKKMNELKEVINDRIIREIKDYLLELTLDNGNLFVQKIDEVLSILTSNNKVKAISPFIPNEKKKVDENNAISEVKDETQSNIEKEKKNDDIKEIVSKTVNQIIKTVKIDDVPTNNNPN